jgi:hypothetical protein
LRLKRDRILDSLEEEESEENERQKRVERKEREEMRRKRRQETVDEKSRLQRTKELQKKMGKALLNNIKPPDTEGDSLPKEVEREKEEGFPMGETSEARKKTVTFVEASGSSPDTRKSNWGDVTAAKLRPGERPTLLQAFRTNNPLKMNVVERKPAGHHSAIQIPLAQNAKDSDDESEPDGNEFHPTPDDNEDDDLVEEPPDSEEDTREVELENEYDLDYAQQQREITLEYYKKRSVMGQDVAVSMMNDTYEETSRDLPVDLSGIDSSSSA